MEKYSLRKLQAAYMKVTLRNEEVNEKTCMYCWSSNCGCDGKHTTKNDPFIQVSFGEMKYV